MVIMTIYTFQRRIKLQFASTTLVYAVIVRLIEVHILLSTV
jgi:hypothetical protein